MGIASTDHLFIYLFTEVLIFIKHRPLSVLIAALAIVVCLLVLMLEVACACLYFCILINNAMHAILQQKLMYIKTNYVRIVNVDEKFYFIRKHFDNVREVVIYEFCIYRFLLRLVGEEEIFSLEFMNISCFSLAISIFIRVVLLLLLFNSVCN